MDGGLSTGDLALMKDNNGLDGNGFFWVFALMILMMGGNGGWFGNNNNNALSDQMAQGFANQQMQQIALSSANNNYETAQLINQLQGTLMQQNNTNLINAIQGFNQVNISLQNLSAQLNSCCCDIKSTMLQNRYEDERAKVVALQNDISNYNQSQYILSQMGRYVAWAGSGAPATVSTGT
jgi:hypothetical protein